MRGWALRNRLRAGKSTLPKRAATADEIHVCIFYSEALSNTVQNMRRQRFESGGSVLVENGWGIRAHRTPGILISLFAAGFAAIFFPGLARAQTGTVVFSQSAYTVDASQSNAVITVIFSGSTNAAATVDFSTGGGSAVA